LKSYNIVKELLVSSLPFSIYVRTPSTRRAEAKHQWCEGLTPLNITSE